MTRFNQKLAEKPDHSHYPVCLDRKMEIDRNSLRLLKYTLLACGVLAAFSAFTARFAVISWIPSLFGDTTEVAPLLIQLLEIALICGVAALNCGRWKICGVILTGLYLSMVIFGNIGMVNDNGADVFTVILGAGGVGSSIWTVNDYLDWNQLSETEGFPQFNERFAYQNDNPDYRPLHTGEGASDKMSSPELVGMKQFTGLDNMPEMPAIGTAKDFGSAGIGDIYIPDSGKYCAMSASPMKIS
ncbi:MAG: hypothetical protein IKO47_06440 [Ruminococcus sp.]|nr:hypothetical protein [Ruminococcus sp.]